MKTMKIFEPAMCCPTGLCGVSVDPELLRISTVLNTLQENGINVERFNLTSAPMEFVTHKEISDFLQKFGPDKLPAITVDDTVVISGRYPSNEEFANWLELAPGILNTDEQSCCSDDCCSDECCADGAKSNECCADDCCSNDCCADGAKSDDCCSDECCADGAKSDDCCSDDAPKCCCSDDCCQ